MKLDFTSWASNSTDGSDLYPGVRHVTVHAPDSDNYKFSLGAAIVPYKELWVCGFLQSLNQENDNESRWVCRYSHDNCETWSDVTVIAGKEGEFSHSHGVFWNDGKTLWTFCPKARYGLDVLHGPGFQGNPYPDMVMEAYTLNTDLTWQFRGTVLDDTFWPLCEPVRLPNGQLLLAGLECGDAFAQGAVAISDGNPLHWKKVNIPNPKNLPIWGETTVIVYEDCLLALLRTDRSRLGYSVSHDFGQTWTDLDFLDAVISNSKAYGGSLSDGRKYLLTNIPGGPNDRCIMAIAFGDSTGCWQKAQPIRVDFDDRPPFLTNQCCYPYAVEKDGFLYAVYSRYKAGTDMTIIPL